jgi:hypothetical protein
MMRAALITAALTFELAVLVVVGTLFWLAVML